MTVPIRRTLATLGVVVVTTVGSTTLLAAPAEAATAGLAKASGSVVTFQALLTKTNSVLITRSGRTFTITDRVAIQAGTGCKRVTTKKVRCTTPKKPNLIKVALGDKDDRLVNNTTVPMYAEGGTGNDVIYGGDGADQLLGLSGKDTIHGRGGADRILGGRGSDTVYGEAGADDLYGDNHTSGIKSGNDVIRGGAGDDGLVGGNGADKLYGEGGDDGIYGGYFDPKTGNPTGAKAADLLNGGSQVTRDICLTTGGATFVSCEFTS